eukprot:4374583-Prymnesium_polylepis.1
MDAHHPPATMALQAARPVPLAAATALARRRLAPAAPSLALPPPPAAVVTAATGRTCCGPRAACACWGGARRSSATCRGACQHKGRVSCASPTSCAPARNPPADDSCTRTPRRGVFRNAGCRVQACGGRGRT